MFYEPLSDFFYDPKSKMYYGNKKFAYFRYDEKEDPPFVEVQKMTQMEGNPGDNIAIDLSTAKAASSKPKIAIKLSTKTVKSSRSTLAAQKCDKQQQQQPATVSKAKQQQIANIGKWNEKQAKLKDEAAPPPPQAKSKIRTTPKGEPICMICKKKFPNLGKLRLHEKASELHKKNVLALQELRKAAAKRKAETQQQQQQQQLYTDRAEKRRQLHGTDLGASQSLSRLQQDKPPPSAPEPEKMTPGGDLFQENNVGHKMLQKMGYQNPGSSEEIANDRPKTANEHLRKEWDRIEAMAQKSSRNRYKK